LLAFSKVAFVT